MVEQDRLDQFGDPGFEELVGAVEQYLKRDRQIIKDSLIKEFLDSHVVHGDLDLTKEPTKLAKVVFYLFSNWKGLLLKGRTPQEEYQLKTLTLNDIASYSSVSLEDYSNRFQTTSPDTPEYKMIKGEVDIWSKVAAITKAAADLEEKGKKPL